MLQPWEFPLLPIYDGPISNKLETVKNCLVHLPDHMGTPWRVIRGGEIIAIAKTHEEAERYWREFQPE